MVQRLGQVLNPPELETPVPFILHIENCTISKLHMLHMTKCVIACQWCITLITSSSHISLQKISFHSDFGCFQMLTSAIRSHQNPVAKLRSDRGWLLRIPCSGWCLTWRANGACNQPTKFHSQILVFNNPQSRMLATSHAGLVEKWTWICWSSVNHSTAFQL